MKTLFVHIGTHKTGTTSFQDVCYKHIKQLNKENIHVINHKYLPASNEFNGETPRKELVEYLRHIFSKNLKVKEEKVLLCWEGFSGHLSNLYSNRYEVLSILKDSLPVGNEKLSIILFLRRQDDFVQSAFSQSVHEGFPYDSLLRTEYNRQLDWLNYVNELKEVFPKAKLNIFPYEKEILKDKSIYALIGEVIDSKFLQNFKPTLDLNVGMSRESAKLFTRIFEQFNLNISNRKLLRRVIQRIAHKGVFNEYDYLNYNDKINLLSKYEESNKKLAQEYWAKKFGLKNFSRPKKYVIDQHKNVKVEDKVINELLNIIQRQKERKSIVLRLAIKVKRLIGF